MEFVKDGELTGFGPELMNAIAREAGFTPVYQVVPWDGIFDRLKKKQVDAILSSITITSARKKEMDFSNPYYESYQAVLTKRSTDFSSMEDLHGKKVGSQPATTSYEACKRMARFHSAHAKPFITYAVAIQTLEKGWIDAVILDAPLAYSYISDDLKIAFAIPSDFPEFFAIALQKNGDVEIKNLINKGLKRIRENGEYEQIFDKWLSKIPKPQEEKGFFNF